MTKIMQPNAKRAMIVLASVLALGMVGCKAKEKSGATSTTAVETQQGVGGGALKHAIPKTEVDPNILLPLQVEALPMKGDANAIVTIIEFSGYQCGFCGRVQPTLAQVLETYPGEVRLGVVNLPLDFHANGLPSAKAVVAAMRQGKFWEMHEELFKNPTGLTMEYIRASAEKIGLDMARFEADMNSEETAAYIRKGIEDAGRLGVRGTPGFLINGVFLSGAQPFENFKAAIDKEIARAKQVAAEKSLSGEALYKELFNSATKPAEAPEAAKPAPPPAAEAARVFIDITGAPVLGDLSAPVTLIEFTDFECPFCARGNTTINQLLENNPGKVKIVFKHFPLDFHQNARLAHQAAEAAKLQGKFWEYYTLLFQDTKALGREHLIKYAEQVGLDMQKFLADLESPAVVAAVQADIDAGKRAGVQGTPHFFFNGLRLSGAQPLQAFQAALDKELLIVQEFLAKGVSSDKLYEEIAKSNIEPKIVVNTAGSPMRGAADAPVTLVLFTEFECPFSKRVTPTLEQLLKEYEGKINLVFKHLPLPFHANAQKAGEAAMAAHAQGKFWEMHDLMFANQQALSVDDLKKYAAQLGLDVERFAAELDSGAYAAIVAADMAAASGAGISGTPTFVINGKLFVGAQPIESFRAVINEALEKK
ncbi:MAG: thioredoxin domain-containing protein [Proteobacteria bacterium]|nr:thioredoxin domain-containing protein [Pseudomonadota bacterium]